MFLCDNIVVIWIFMIHKKFVPVNVRHFNNLNYVLRYNGTLPTFWIVKSTGQTYVSFVISLYGWLLMPILFYQCDHLDYNLCYNCHQIKNFLNPFDYWSRCEFTHGWFSLSCILLLCNWFCKLAFSIIILLCPSRVIIRNVNRRLVELIQAVLPKIIR